MATTCKLRFGYVDNWGYWITKEEFYRHYDGYDEAIIPHLKKHINSIKNNGNDVNIFIKNMNNDVESDGHKFEKDTGFGNTNYIYYIDTSNRANIKCTVLSEDMEFYKKFGVNNYKIEMELIL